MRRARMRAVLVGSEQQIGMRPNRDAFTANVPELPKGNQVIDLAKNDVMAGGLVDHG